MSEPASAGQAGALPAGQLFWRMGRLMRKETSSILRDRRTIFTLVLMPLLLYPLLTIAFRQFLLASALTQQADSDYRLGFLTPSDEAPFRRQVVLGTEVLRRQWPQRPAAGKAPNTFSYRSYHAPSLEEAVRNRQIDLGVRLLDPAPGVRWWPGRDRYLVCELVYLESSVSGREAREHVERLLAAANNAQLAQRLEVPGVRPRFLFLGYAVAAAGGAPVCIIPGAVLLEPRAEGLPAEKSGETVPLSALVPLILILMTITGAVYPAIDLTAGERERGTLEILVAAPIPRLGLLFAKYVSVVTVAVLTAVVNLVTMTVTLLVSGLGTVVFGEAGLRASAVVHVFFLLLLFALFFSAVLLAVTSFARSFKEAQAYLIPLMLVAMTPGMLSLLPAVKLEGPMQVVPLLNIVLLTREVFAGYVPAAVTALVVVTTLVYALAAIALAARIFGAEAVLYNEQASWSDLFRRPARGRPVPMLSSALFCLALMFPAWFVVSNLLGQLRDAGPAAEMALRVAANGVLFLGFPLASVWLRRVRPATAFRATGAGAAAWAPAVLLGLSLWPFALGLHELLKWLGLATLNEQLLPRVEVALSRLRELSPVVVVFGAAVVPAVVEELFFRGYLFSALCGTPRRGGGAGTAVVGSAVLFGLFHLVGHQVLIVEWGVTATLLGLLLGWLSWKTGSVVPGMILHALHNGCVILLGYYKPELVRAGWIGPQQRTAPESWLLAAGAGCVLAAVWLFVAFGRRAAASQDLVPTAEEG